MIFNLMGNVLENSLFFQDFEKFRNLSEKVIQFNSTYNGNNIIQDDIFSILVNYARKNGEELGVFRFPTEDDDFCAFTCVKKGNIYVYVNSYLPLANQIFAVPYKAMLLRLHEDGYMDADTVHEFMRVEPEVLQKEIIYEPHAARWHKRTPEIVQMANLRQLLDQNQEYELISDSRAESDKRTFEEILNCYTNRRG